MQDLIKRSDAIKTMRDTLVAAEIPYAVNALFKIPAVEPKHGIWVRAYRNFDQTYHNYCSICKEWNGLDVEGWNWRPNFCPNCGAKMEKVEDEE